MKLLQKLRWKSALLMIARNPTTPIRMTTRRAMPQPIRHAGNADLRGAGGCAYPAGGWLPMGCQAAPSQYVSPSSEIQRP